jgi:CspA family cold shock protein
MLRYRIQLIDGIRKRVTMAMFSGEVVWFNNAKGFGFLKSEHGPDVFCHYSSMVSEGYKTLGESDRVEFEVIQGIKVSRKRITL